MSLLELPALELRQKIEAELSRNPALELVDECRCPTCHRILYGNQPCPFCTQNQLYTNDEPIIYLSSRGDFFEPNAKKSALSDLPEENLTPSTEDLPHYVMRQIAPELLPADRTIAAHILTSLDDDGLLAVPISEIAYYHHVPATRVEHVLRQIQHADPLGVGSPTPQDALLVQLEFLSESRKIPPKCDQAIRSGLDHLSHHRYPELAKLLDISISQAKEISRFISQNLNPYPAHAHWGDTHQSSKGSETSAGAYHFADVIITCLEELEDSPLVVEIAMPIHGTLRVNPLFREALQQAPPEKADLWHSDLDRANLFVKCLQQRNHTFVRLMQKIAILQRNFILHGESQLQPITRATLAQELDVHESTMSRAVAGKTIQLPNRRIVPLSMFFDRSLHIRTALKQIVNEEKQPLNDAQIVNRLSELGFPVARRTVAKYRAMEGILPAHLRPINQIQAA
jgi:RNA polymerase sigma-54 factor